MPEHVVPEELSTGLIGPSVDPVDIDFHNDVRDRGQKSLVARRHRPKLFLRELTLGNISSKHGHAGDLAGGIEQRTE